VAQLVKSLKQVLIEKGTHYMQKQPA
jgi:hypothetical protein